MSASATLGSDTAKSPYKKRRRYMVNAVFQWKYTILVILGVFFTSAVMSSLLFGVLHQQARQAVLHQAIPDALPLGRGFAIVFLSAAAFSAVLSIAFGFWTMIITHRIYGPVYVLERFVSELADGRFPKYRPLRKKDEFKEFYDAFWRAVASLKESKRAEVAALSEAIRMARSAAQGDDEQRKKAMGLMVKQLEAIRKQSVTYLGEEEAAVILDEARPAWEEKLKRAKPLAHAST